MTDWTLHGTTERSADDWAPLCADLAGWHAAWADLDGIHIADTLPDTLPVTSHLWAWAANGWVRVRVDGGRWWASALLHDGATVDLSTWATTADAVAEVTIDRIWSWAADDGRTAQMRRAAGTVVAEQMVQLVPVRAQPSAYIGDLASAAGLPNR